MDFKIKVLPEDFLVTEEPDQDLLKPDKAGMYFLYKLTKKNISTFDAINYIAQDLGLNLDTIGYSGLKDEDGVTVQYITLAKNFFEDEITLFNEKLKSSKSFVIALNYLHKVKAPLVVRGLKGNHFKITVREIDLSLLEKIEQKGSSTISFINYYDTQRFGTPDSPKNTHKIGACLVNSDAKNALILLKTQNNLLAQNARDFLGNDPNEFFESMEKRHLMFFYSSYYSYCWNESVKNIILKHAIEGTYHDQYKDDIHYIFIKNQEDINEVFRNNLCLEYKRPTLEKERIIIGSGHRDTISRVKVDVVDWGLDMTTEKKSAFVQVQFYLPMGNYATMAVSAFMSSCNESD